jgi:NADPH:quinone reductase-like Zn-dependent oxidoreductase
MERDMKSKMAACAIAMALAVPMGAHALGKNEKGCLVGGAAGGVGGKLLGDHPVLGAAAGCAVGTVVAKKRAQKEQHASKHAPAKVARDHPREERAAADRAPPSP